MPGQVVVLAIGAALLPLAAWPALAEPFLTPKRFVLRLTAAGVVACWLAAPSRLRHLPHTAALLVLPLLMLAGMGVVRAIPGSGPVTLDLLATAVIALAAAGVDGQGRRVVGAGLVIGAALLSLLAVLQFLGLDGVAAAGGVVDWGRYADKMRMYGTMGSPNRVGVVAALGLPVALGLVAVTRRNRWRRKLAGAAASVMALALFVTFCKAAVVASMVSLVLLRPLAERRRRWSGWGRMVAATALVGAAVAFVLVLPHYSRGQDRPDRNPARPWSEAASGRFMLWREGVAVAGRAPLWGLGPTGLSRRFAADGSRARHAHNDYIEILAEGGLLLAAVCAVALGAVLLAGRRRRRQLPEEERPLQEASALALLVLAAVAVVDFPMQRPAERALAFLLAGLVISPARNSAAPDLPPVPWGPRIGLATASVLLLFALITESRMVFADRLLWRAEGLERYGHDRRADRLYRRAARLGADRFRLRLGLGRIALDRGRYTQAEEHARAACRLFPDPAALSLLRRVAALRPDPVTAPLETRSPEEEP